MIDLFRILKLDYKEYVILLKSGGFYLIFDEDATIINSIFDYKIVDLKNNIKVGFPLNNLKSVKDRLRNININYIIVDNKCIIEEYKTNHNKFKKYKASVYDYVFKYNKINDICITLKNNLSNSNIYEVLNEIDEMLKLHKFSKK